MYLIPKSQQPELRFTTWAFLLAYTPDAGKAENS